LSKCENAVRPPGSDSIAPRAIPHLLRAGAHLLHAVPQSASQMSIRGAKKLRVPKPEDMEALRVERAKRNAVLKARHGYDSEATHGVVFVLQGVWDNGGNPIDDVVVLGVFPTLHAAMHAIAPGSKIFDEDGCNMDDMIDTVIVAIKQGVAAHARRVATYEPLRDDHDLEDKWRMWGVVEGDKSNHAAELLEVAPHEDSDSESEGESEQSGAEPSPKRVKTESAANVIDLTA